LHSRSIPCRDSGILASGGAVRGLGRDCNCREYGGCGGDVLFIVGRKKIHAETPPAISEMADGGFAIGTLIETLYALCIRPRSDNGDNLSGIPHGRHTDYIS
jgi:hypothetical protein